MSAAVPPDTPACTCDWLASLPPNPGGPPMRLALAIALMTAPGCTVDSKDYHVERINGVECVVYSKARGVICPTPESTR